MNSSRRRLYPIERQREYKNKNTKQIRKDPKRSRKHKLTDHAESKTGTDNVMMWYKSRSLKVRSGTFQLLWFGWFGWFPAQGGCHLLRWIRMRSSFLQCAWVSHLWCCWTLTHSVVGSCCPLFYSSGAIFLSSLVFFNSMGNCCNKDYNPLMTSFDN